MKNYLLLSLLFILVGSYILSAQDPPGAGTPSDPFRISTVGHLQAVMNTTSSATLSSYFKLMNNINCGNITFTQTIGNTGNCFSGYFDGQNFTISNFILDASSSFDNQGIFGCVSSGTITNVNISNFHLNNNLIIQDIYGAGGLCGYISNSSLINNCSASSGTFTNLVTGYNVYNFGGLIGFSENYSVIINCYTTSISMLLNEYCTTVGGMVGYAINGVIISNSHSSAIVSGNQNIGCFIGTLGDVFASIGSTVTHCYSSGSALGTKDIGGFCGRFEGCYINNSYSTANASATFSDCGGFIGIVIDSAFIESCYATGNVTLLAGNTGGDGNGAVGGFCGFFYYIDIATVRKCYASGDIILPNRIFTPSDEPLYNIGGFVGRSDAVTYENCYSQGNITGAYSTSITESGGFIGGASGVTLTNCYSTGNVPGTLANSNGGFAGTNNFSSFNCCFWDITTSGHGILEGTGNTGTPSGLTGKTTAEMQIQSTFSCFDFNNIWTMNGYPVFRTGPAIQTPDLTYWSRIAIILSMFSLGIYLIYRKFIV